MNDNDVIAALIVALRVGLDLKNLQNVLIKQNYQPRDIGTPSQPTIFLHKIMADRYGFPSRKDVFNESTRLFDHTEAIWRTPTFQLDGLSTQDPANINSLTASDIVETAADVLQSQAFQEALIVDRIGIQRITSVRENYFTNDRERFQQNPSFDFILTYRPEWQSTVQPVNTYTFTTRPIC